MVLGQLQHLTDHAGQVALLRNALSSKWRPNQRHGCGVRMVVYLGDREFRHEAGIDVVPFERFVEDVDRGLWAG